jgi:hypothetical protein
MHGGKRRELILLQDSEVGLSVLNVVRIRFLEPHVGWYHTINDEYIFLSKDTSVNALKVA